MENLRFKEEDVKVYFTGKTRQLVTAKGMGGDQLQLWLKTYGEKLPTTAKQAQKRQERLQQAAKAEKDAIIYDAPVIDEVENDAVAEMMKDKGPHYCERCERLIMARVVWLELNAELGAYVQPGVKVPESHSQGFFPFGADCANYPNSPYLRDPNGNYKEI